jgi:hypothetical protein
MIRTLRFSICCALVGGMLSHRAAAQAAVPDSVRYPCRSVHTFDYWVGTWEATPWNQPKAQPGGTLTNTREYEGCVFVERWEGKGGRGMSLVMYDATKKTWRMFWNDDSNGSTVFDQGLYRDGAMRFTGWTTSPKGDVVMASNVLQNVSADTIRHLFSISRDSGRTWLTLSDGRFARRKE